MMALIPVIPKNIEKNSQLRDEYTRKFNRLCWLRLFWLYGLQLHYDDERNSFSKWKKSVTVLLLHFLTVLFILRYIMVMIRWPQYEMLVAYFPIIIFNTVSIRNAVFLLRRETKFTALYKILLEVAMKCSENIKRIQSQIYIVLFILVLFNVLLLIDTMTYIALTDNHIAYYLPIYTEFNFHLLRIFVFFEYIFYIIYTQFFLDITVLYFSYMCKLLSLAFKNLNEEMERSFGSTSILTNAKLNKFRRQYRHLSHLAEQISENFSPLVLFWLVGMIVIFCVRIRSLKNVPEILTALHYGFEINIMKGKVSEIMIFDEDETEGHQMRISMNCLLFSQTLNADTVGISVSGLFLLSTVSFLNMASTVMTYVVSVYQS
uniref:Gustatory receptor n=1 Tax=Strigamia maritima TaxID=126957 RepID=T1JJU7_STRMM